MKEVDLLIIGAGPAGSALAARLQQGRLLMVDKRYLFDDELIYKTEKCCGGMLDETAMKTLSSMRIPLPAEVLMEPSVFAVRALDFDNDMERLYPRNYLNIDRAKFDRMLLERAMKSAGSKAGKSGKSLEVWERARVSGIRKDENGGYIATIHRLDECLKDDDHGGHEDDHTVEEVRAKIVVGADGAASMVRSVVKAETKEGAAGAKVGAMTFRETPMYVAVQERFEVDEPLDSYYAMFDQRVTDFYSWVIPKKNEILVGSTIPQDGNRGGLSTTERFALLKEDLKKKGFDLSRSKGRSGAMILRPKAFGTIHLGGEGVYLTGEAAGFISPSSSEGISFALRSGNALGKAINEAGLENKAGIEKAYARRVLGLKASIALKTLKSPIMYRPIPRKLVFLTGALSAKDES